MAVSGREQRFVPLIHSQQLVWSPWGPGQLTPFHHLDDDEEADQPIGSFLTEEADTPKSNPRELKRSHSWGSFTTFTQRDRVDKLHESDTERDESTDSGDSNQLSGTPDTGNSKRPSFTITNSTEGESSEGDTKELKVKKAPTSVADLGTATTLMIRNLPFNLKRNELLQGINSSGFAGTYDFLYLPHKFREHRNLGFAFINFDNVEYAKKFHEVWHLSRRFMGKGGSGSKGVKPLNISVSAVQGRDANVRQANSHKVERVKNTSYRPFVSMGLPSP
jgi:hypothetical protein